MKRRDYLTGLAGVGALGASGTAAGEDVQLLTTSLAVGDDTHHPGPPRFMQVGEVIVDPVFVNATHGFDRDNLAPSIVGEPQRDGEEYDASDFSWSVKSKPDDSTEDIRYAAEPTEGAGGGDPYDVDDPADGTPRWEPGHQNVAEFVPDVPGTYVLELDAPDGTHEQTIRVFPEAPGGVNEAFHPNNPPRLTLNVADESGDTFVLEADLAAAPESNATVADLSVEALADDRDGPEKRRRRLLADPRLPVRRRQRRPRDGRPGRPRRRKRHGRVDEPTARVDRERRDVRDIHALVRRAARVRRVAA